MRKAWWVVVVGLILVVAMVATAEVKRRVWEPQTMSADGTLVFLMPDAAVAQFTFSVASGTPDGTVSVYGRQAAGGAETLMGTVGVVGSTKTYICDAMGLMEVRLASHSTGAISVEASSR